MGHNYTDEEVAQLDQNLETINGMWNQYVLERLNGNEDDPHNPPALNRAVSDLLDYVLMNMAQENITAVGTELFAGFAANMFAFGQWASENGLKMSNLFSCKCAEVTDEDIKNLLNNS